VSEEPNPDNERGLHRDSDQNIREEIGALLSAALWVLVDLRWVWPESHEWALLFGIGYLVFQCIERRTLLKSYRALSTGVVGVLVVGAVAYYFLPATPKIETFETHGWLTPGDDPTPPNDCPKPASDEILFLAGNEGIVVGRDETYKISVVQCGSRGDLLRVNYTPDGLLVDADVFASNGDLVARIKNNEFHLVTGKYSYSDRPDLHTLVVHDRQGQRDLLSVSYPNPSTIEVRGIFFCPGNPTQIVLDENGLRAYAPNRRPAETHGGCTVVTHKAPYTVFFLNY
jgi:hypothetical protein